MIPDLDFLSVAETQSANVIFDALNSLVQQRVGAKIFTCSTFDPVTHQAARVYSNQPDAYPVSGLKDVVANRWTVQVLDQGQTFVANETAGFADIFPDYVLINSLGCHSVVNMPIVLSGRTLGTLNLLHEANYFTPDRVAQIATLRLQAIVAFCAGELK